MATTAAQTQLSLIGLMSGSSLDGLDMAHCTFVFDEAHRLTSWTINAADCASYLPEWTMRLRALPQGSALELAKCHADFGRYTGELVNLFLANNPQLPLTDYVASHGHTIFHSPLERFTTQIGDGAAIAAVTNLPVIADFRSVDVALEGQGAPVAPIADRDLFSGHDFYLNLGGIANISSLNQGGSGGIVAFDICACNAPMNALTQTIGLEYDENGTLAASGKRVLRLEAILAADDYFIKSAPKSLANQWVFEHATSPLLSFDATIEDKLATMVAHITEHIALSIEEFRHKGKSSVLVTGGGAFNTFLIDELRKLLPQHDIIVPDTIAVKFKEAALMAYMGALRALNRPNVMKSVTGATRDSIGGCIYRI